MGKVFYMAAGALLVLVGAVVSFLHTQELAPHTGRVLAVSGGLSALGLLLLVLGLRSPFEPAHRPWVTRKLTAWNLVLGPAIIGLGATVLYLFTQVVHVMPRLVVLGALLVIPLGVFVTASVFADACARCDRLLERRTLRFTLLAQRALERLRAGDVVAALGSLGEPTPDGVAHLEVGYCPCCRSVAVCRAGGAPIVLRETSARLLIDRVQRG